jgi:hypothetical protein
MGQSRTIHWSGRGIQPTLVGQPFMPRHSIQLGKQRAVNVLQLIEIQSIFLNEKQRILPEL